MKLDEYLNLGALIEDFADGFVRAQDHPLLPLTILNYTNRTQIEGEWNDVTRKCRGLIYNRDTLEVISRPFEKFFNHNQPEAPSWALWPEKDVRVLDKMDGSLGIIYPNPSTPTGFAVATRGSFLSDQAIKATEILNTRFADFWHFEGATYLVEILYPENRIVVDYGTREDLVLLDILDNQTGESMLDSIRTYYPQKYWPFPRAQAFAVADVMKDRPNAEGYVISNVKTGERVKVKFEEYKRLHKILTGVSEKTIWEILSNDGDLSTLLDVVPDEFYDWVNKTARELTEEYSRIFVTTWQGYLKARVMFAERKDFALYVKDSEFKDIYFGLLDGKDVSKMIWKRLKPEYAKPFWNLDDDA